MSSSLYPTKRDVVLLFLVGLLAGAIALLSALVSPAADLEFLNTFIQATTSLLASTAVILAVFFPALHLFVSDIDKQIRPLERALGDQYSTEDDIQQIKREIAKFEYELRGARMAQLRALTGLTVSVGLLGVALVVELLHLRLLAGLDLSMSSIADIWSRVSPWASLLRPLASLLEFFLVIAAILLVVLTLVRTIHLAFR
jgi:hypothetical protein